MQTPYPPEVDIPFAIHITNNKRRPCGEKINRRAAFIAILYEKEEIPGYEQDIDTVGPQLLHILSVDPGSRSLPKSAGVFSVTDFSPCEIVGCYCTILCTQALALHFYT